MRVSLFFSVTTALLYSSCVRDTYLQKTEQTEAEETTEAATSTPPVDDTDSPDPEPDNTAPEIGTITLSPDPLYTNDVLTAVVEAVDAEADPITLRYDWYVDNQAVQSSEQAELDGNQFFNKGQEVYVVVTPSDGIDTGASVPSLRLTVANSLPSAPVLSITPTEAFEGSDDLLCSITQESIDADQDPLVYTYNWLDPTGVSRQLVEATTELSNTYPASGTIEGVWTCEVYASDEAGNSDTSTATVEVQNTIDWTMMVTSFTTRKLYSVEMISGTVTEIGDTTVPLRALAYDQTTEILYGSDGGSLYTVDPLTGATSLVGASLGSVESMLWRNGQLLGFEFNGGDELKIIDPSTGSFAGTFGTTGYNRIRGLAHDQSSGEMYGIHLPPTFAGEGVLLQLDPQTAAASEIGITGLAGLANLAIDQSTGILWGIQDEVGPDFLVQIDRATGLATVTLPLGEDGMRGLAFIAH